MRVFLRIFPLLLLWLAMGISGKGHAQVLGEQKISALSGGFPANVLDTGDWLGTGMDTIGDFNGDGVMDIVVGARNDDDGFIDAGAIYILFMSSTGTVINHQKISQVEGWPGATLQAEDWFGGRVICLGDINSDGVVDLAVSAQGDDDGGERRGACYILFLDSNAHVKKHQKISDLEGGFTSTLNNRDRLSSGLSVIGDINNDGVVDLALGALGDDDGGNRKGAVYIVNIDTSGMVIGEQKISSTQGGFTGVLDTVDLFGVATYGPGDLNQDGVPDLFVSSSRDDDGGIDRGAVWLLYLNSNGTVQSSKKISDSQSGFGSGLANGDWFGYGITGIPDMDGDGNAELIVGANRNDGGGIDRGSAWVLYLDDNEDVKCKVKIDDQVGGFGGSLDNDDRFGRAMTHIGDLNGDGSPELVVSAHRDDDQQVNSGAVYILFTDLLIEAPEINGDTMHCQGKQVLLEVDSGYASYLWSTGDTTTSLLASAQINPISVTVTDVNGCPISGADTVNLIETPNPVVDLGPDTLLCVGDSIELHALNQGNSFSWNTGSTDSSIVALNGGTYSVIVSDSLGCSDTSDIFIENVQTPIAASIPDTVMCSGDSILLSGTGQYASFLWQNGSTDSTLMAHNTGDYWVEISNMCGSVIDSGEIKFDVPLTFNINDALLCENEVLQIPVQTLGATLQSNGVVNDTTVYIYFTGNYWVMAQNACGVYTDSFAVDFEVIPDIDLGPNRKLCELDSAQFDATFSRSSYQWSSGDTLPQVTFFHQGDYVVTVTNFCGQDIDTVSLHVDPLLNPYLGPDKMLCYGDQTILSPGLSDADQYLWSTGDTTKSINASSSGYYWIEMRNACGIFTDSVLISYRGAPVIDLPDDTTICIYQTIPELELRPKEAAFSYLWQDSSRLSTYTLNEEGLYWVEVRNQCGSSRDSIYIDFRSPPKVDLGGDTVFCPTFSPIEWGSDQLGLTYLWQDGSTDEIYVPSSVGSYSVQVTDSFGCIASDSIVLDYCPVFLYIPDAFSPNGDGINDVFKPEGELVVDYTMDIYNRWGERIFHSNQLDHGWDGAYDGLESQQGVYVYSIFYKGEHTTGIYLRGKVTLIR